MTHMKPPENFALDFDFTKHLPFPVVKFINAELDCTINDLSHNYFKITDPMYDTDSDTFFPSFSDHGYTTSNVSEIDISEPYSSVVQISQIDESEFFLLVKPIDEKFEPSRGRDFYYNFVIDLYCSNENTVKMYTSIPLIDTNNHEPFFTQAKYVYNLISLNFDDFQRQMVLHPIEATDYDVTNDRLEFSINKNDHFDIEYNGIVPHTLNKKHFAKLVPKISLENLIDPLEIEIKVTDMGFPSRSAVSRVLIYPPSPPTPNFDKTFYTYHYYKNHTLHAEDTPTLEEGTSKYETSFSSDCDNFKPHLDDGNFVIYYSYLSDSRFYQQNYIACELKAQYKDPVTQRKSTGRATLIIELHHDL